MMQVAVAPWIASFSVAAFMWMRPWSTITVRFVDFDARGRDGEEGACAAALSDAVRVAGNDDAGEAGHGRMMAWIDETAQLNALSP